MTAREPPSPAADVAAPATAARARRRGPSADVILAAVVVLLAAAAPPVLAAMDEAFFVTVIHRALILGIAAMGLNLALGFGGLIGFGHAAFIGLGAYAAGIPIHHGYENGLLHLAIALLACGLFALVTGAISLRTRAVHFIMITLAFGQMAYFLFVSLEAYGGDDGLVLFVRSSLPGLDLYDRTTLYYLTLAVVVAVLVLTRVVTRSSFGLVIRAARGSERRTRAAGFSPTPYFLTLYVLSGMITGLAGFLLANFTDFIAPSMMAWTRSGELLFMVILGGIGTLAGPLVGALAYLIAEEILSGFTVYWQFFFGILLILVVLGFRRGLSSLLPGGRR